MGETVVGIKTKINNSTKMKEKEKKKTSAMWMSVWCRRLGYFTLLEISLENPK